MGNTFIHVDPDSRSVHNSRKRARSVPKDFGSQAVEPVVVTMACQSFQLETPLPSPDVFEDMCGCPWDMSSASTTPPRGQPDGDGCSDSWSDSCDSAIEHTESGISLSPMQKLRAAGQDVLQKMHGAQGAEADFNHVCASRFDALPDSHLVGNSNVSQPFMSGAPP